MKINKKIFIITTLAFLSIRPSLADKDHSFKNTSANTDNIIYYDDFDLDLSIGLKANPKKKKSSKKDSINYQEATVESVIDGDTVLISVDRKVGKLRLIGVDTPETVHPHKPIGFYGKEASAFTKEKLSGKKVYIEKDVSQTDRYNRLLRYIWLELPSNIVNPSFEDVRDKMFNGILLRDGYANQATFPPDVKYQEYFRLIEEKAREEKKGLWNENKREEFLAKGVQYPDLPKKTLDNLTNEKVKKAPQVTASTSVNLTSSKPSNDNKKVDRDNKFKYPKGDRPIADQVVKSVKKDNTTYMADQTQGPIKGNRKTGVYHLQGQRDYNKISVDNVTWFYSEKEATNKNYRPAKR